MVAIGKTKQYGDLRYLSTRILRVISEASCSFNPTRHKLCDAEAVLALGKILYDDVTFIRSLVENSTASSHSSDLINDSLSNDILAVSKATPPEGALQEMRQVLRGISSIFYSSNISDDERLEVFHIMLKACSQLISSGGITSLLWLSSAPLNVCS